MAISKSPSEHTKACRHHDGPGYQGRVIRLEHDIKLARRERWGISYYIIFEPYVDAFAPVVARLARV
jgi:hypothetical protein